MEIRVGTVLVDFDGHALRHPDTGQLWTVGSVLYTVALGSPPPGTTYTKDESVGRYMVGKTIYDALKHIEGTGDVNWTVDLAPEIVDKLKADIVRSFGPIVVGQIDPLLG